MARPVDLTELLAADLGFQDEIDAIMRGEDVEPVAKGSETSGYYGPRPGTGRPGEIGGSQPRGGGGGTPIPDEQLTVLHAMYARGIVEPEQLRAVEDGVQEFARDIEARQGKQNWLFRITEGQLPGHFIVTVKGTDPKASITGPMSGSTLSFTANGKGDLHMTYVGVPKAAQHKGMGTEMVDMVRTMAVNGGFTSVSYDAANGNGMVGAYVWAKMGAKFADEDDRTRIGYKYANWVEDQGLKTKLNLSTVEPGDILNDTPGGKPLGKLFMSTQEMLYTALVPVTR